MRIKCVRFLIHVCTARVAFATGQGALDMIASLIAVSLQIVIGSRLAVISMC